MATDAAAATPIQTVVRHPGALLEQYGVEMPPGTAADQRFAVIKMSGTQYKVTLDDVVVTNLIHGYEVGAAGMWRACAVGPARANRKDRPHPSARFTFLDLSLPPSQVGETMEVDEVLLVGSRDETVVGRPLVESAKVRLLVEEHTKDKKVRDSFASVLASWPHEL